MPASILIICTCLLELLLSISWKSLLILFSHSSLQILDTLVDTIPCQRTLIKAVFYESRFPSTHHLICPGPERSPINTTSLVHLTHTQRQIRISLTANCRLFSCCTSINSHSGPMWVTARVWPKLAFANIHIDSITFNHRRLLLLRSSVTKNLRNI